ncbi:MAG: efflux RND transporter periplasmic adaptor subunit [Alphaproteobacteria bacterium]|nr:efflux RND transporter periplasmic adaptor subunit [Alphaproteobacteria bacterium]
MHYPILRTAKNGALIGLCLLVLAGCKEDPDPNAPPEPRTLELAVTQARIEQIDRLYSTPGSVTSEERIEVSSRATGYIQRISAHEGDVISEGDILVEIDPTDVEGTISRAEAALSSAQTTLEDTEQDVTRQASLVAQGVASNETLRRANVARDKARSSLAEAQAALDTALAGRRYTTLVSPIDGIVVARQKHVGDLATPGVPILTIESRSRLLFRTSVSESRIGNVRMKAPVRVTIDALAGRDIMGQVRRIIPSGDPVTRRYDVEIALPAGLDAFPGMFGRAHFSIATDTVVMVPNDALLERGGLTGVFVMDDDMTARFRWLHTGRVFAQATEIRGGLQGNETIIAHDDIRLRDGDRVVITGQASTNE